MYEICHAEKNQFNCNCNKIIEILHFPYYPFILSYLQVKTIPFNTNVQNLEI